MITADQLLAAIPAAGADRAARFIDPINAALERYRIDTPIRIAAFLGNVGHESGGLRRLEENLNYSSDGLVRVFRRHFPDADVAERYARQPERIANRAYANRMGNGDEASGDGWRYRGRGLFQVTGRDNYGKASIALFGYPTRLLTEPELLADPQWAAMSAGWYWDANRLNDLADRHDLDGVCDVINRGHKTAAEGDAIGYHERIALIDRAMEALA